MTAAEAAMGRLGARVPSRAHAPPAARARQRPARPRKRQGNWKRERIGRAFQSGAENWKVSAQQVSVIRTEALMSGRCKLRAAVGLRREYIRPAEIAATMRTQSRAWPRL